MTTTAGPTDDGQLLRSFSPQAPADLVGEFRISSGSEVERAVRAAHAAQREWWALGAAGRAAALAAAATRLSAEREKATALVVREVGKPVSEAAGEVARAISILTYYSQACFAAIGDLYPPSLAGLLFSQRRPHGVAGLITPWNFPLAIPLWKSAPALASGNAVVLKPAPAAPACARLIEDLLAPHLPDGAFSLVHGDADTGRALVNAADIISFTGSDRVGRADDADPALAAKLVAGAAMGYAGQKCTATRRVIVVDNTEFVDALVAAVSAIPAQAPESPDTTVGPLISEDARAKVLRAVELARSAGGQVVAGGAAMPGEGWYVAPTLITGLAPDHPLAQQETFGPIATIHNARDAEEAVRIANGVRFGLVTSLHGRDLDRLLQSANAIDTGLIKVNAPTTGGDFYAPFGGEKDSSYGPREQGLDALAFYSSTRTVTIAPHGAGG